MYLLCEHFHKHLDEILIKHPNIKNQEIINNELFTKKIRKTHRINKKINNRKSRSYLRE